MVFPLRFLSLLHCEPTDYVDVSRRLYAGQSIDEIFDRAEQQGADNPSVDLRRLANGLTRLLPGTIIV